VYVCKLLNRLAFGQFDTQNIRVLLIEYR
jgi:hypothetical protein